MGAKTWNELPKILKDSTSQFSFQKIPSKFYVGLNYLELDAIQI